METHFWAIMYSIKIVFIGSSGLCIKLSNVNENKLMQRPVQKPCKLSTLACSISRDSCSEMPACRGKIIARMCLNIYLVINKYKGAAFSNFCLRKQKHFYVTISNRVCKYSLVCIK